MPLVGYRDQVADVHYRGAYNPAGLKREGPSAMTLLPPQPLDGTLIRRDEHPATGQGPGRLNLVVRSSWRFFDLDRSGIAGRGNGYIGSGWRAVCVEMYL
jgi:hypothetical protein